MPGHSLYMGSSDRTKTHFDSVSLANADTKSSRQVVSRKSYIAHQKPERMESLNRVQETSKPVDLSVSHIVADSSLNRSSQVFRLTTPRLRPIFITRI